MIENSGLNTSLVLINISVNDEENSARIETNEKKWISSVHISKLGEKIKSLFTIPESEINLKSDFKEITRSKDLLFTIYHKSPNAICVSRLSDGIIVDFNDTFSKALKYNNDELLGTTGLELGFWDKVEERDQIVKAVKANGSLKDFHGCKPDKFGNFIYFTGNFELIIHEGIEYLLCNFYDITEKTKAKNALIESENQYRFLADHATDMISRMDRDANFTYMSPASDIIIYYKPEEVLGHSAFEYMHADYLINVKKDHEQLMRTKESIIIIHRVRKKNGEYVWLESKASAVVDNLEGIVTEIISVTRDIT
ncbi:MAG: PAS domain-containing protein, partial [Ignavibacteria bacterium]|nr:PAS domain-containing protein [Ignavibacteria bacterium]